MDLELSAAQREVRERARAVATATVGPLAEEHDRQRRFPGPQVRALADAGLLAVLAPTAAGGAGAGAVAYSLAVTEVARACAATAVTMAVTNMVADAIGAFGSEAQATAHVPRLASAEYLAGSFCLSEASAGSDAAALSTTATREASGYRLDGNKLWITSGDVAGIYLVMAKTDPAARARGISTFLVRPGTPGLVVGRHEEKMGLRASSTVALHLEEVFVPQDDRLGPEGVGFSVAMRALDGGRIGIGSQALGIAEGALEAARPYVRGRPGTYARFGELSARLEAARWLVLRAAALKDAGSKDFTKEASMAKLFSTETANQICREAVGWAGPEALVPGHPLERRFRDVRVTTIYEGTSEIQRLVIARKLLTVS